MGAKTKLGAYKLECIAAAGDAGTFQVVDPDGYRLPDAEVGVAYTHGQINFTLTDGASDFVVGDKFEIAIDEPAEEHWVESEAAAVDGSQEIDCILTEDVDATSADVQKSGYITGDFNEYKLTFGTGHTADSLREAARKLLIFFHSVKVMGQ